MKVVSAREQSRVEKEAFASGVADEALMEIAGLGVAKFVEDQVEHSGRDWWATLLCGKGNNAGDAYVAGRHLRGMGYKVRACQLVPIDSCSPLCRKQQHNFIEAGGEVVDTVDLQANGVILDGLFGTGFSGEVSGIFAEAIAAANASELPRYAIDIPSGVNGTTGDVGGTAFKADWTIFLEYPNTGFFLGDAWNYVGRLHGVELGLPDNAKADFEMMEVTHAKGLLPPIVRTRHKYQAGYVAGFAGSDTMPGAAILASDAALRSGAGMMRLFHPPDMDFHGLGLPPEVLVSPNTEEIGKADAVFIGPGMGREPETATFIGNLLKTLDRPCVIDADALYHLAENDWDLPEHTVLTPQAAELKRLLKDQSIADYVKRKNVTIVQKGAPNFVHTPNQIPWVIPKGDPGMATAGCGDVLTGIIASLLAQGLMPFDAARLGVWLHGEAGEQAAFDLTSRALLASDVTLHLPEAFATL